MPAAYGVVIRVRWLHNGERFGYNGDMGTEVKTEDTEATMLARAFGAEKGDLPVEAAKVLLNARLPDADLRRMEHLGELAQQGSLSPAERREAEAFDRVGLLLELLQSKARLSLSLT